MILSRLGRGGVADVLKAVHARTGRVVALKILHTRHATNTYIKEHMLAEAELLSSLNHANVVRVEDVGSENGVLWMAMEFLSGVTLRALLRRCGRMELTTALYFAREIADGVAAAHEMQVVHRDLKPENIMITEDNRVKVLDMGAGKFYGWDLRGTQTGTIMGTPLYMSPEHIRAEPIDVRADVYSLGLILYEMLAGAHPFANGSESPLAKYEVCERQLHTHPPPLTSVVEGIPKEVSDLVQRALAKDKALRPSSMREFAKSVRELLKKILLEAPRLRSLPLIQASEDVLDEAERPPELSGAASSRGATEEPARAGAKGPAEPSGAQAGKAAERNLQPASGKPIEVGANRASPSAEPHGASDAMQMSGEGDEDDDADAETLVMSRDEILNASAEGPHYTENHTEIMHSSWGHGHDAAGASVGAPPAAGAEPGGLGAERGAILPTLSPAVPVVRTDLWPPSGSNEAAAVFVSLRRSRRVDKTLRMLLGSACIALGLSFTYSMVLNPRRARVDVPDAMLELADAASTVDTEQLAEAEPPAPQASEPREAPAPLKPRPRSSRGASQARIVAEAPVCPGGTCGNRTTFKEASRKDVPIELMKTPFTGRDSSLKGGDSKAKKGPPKGNYTPGAI
jgi:serine/threonine protein kinase